MYLYVFFCIFMYLYVFICILMYFNVFWWFVCIWMYLYVFLCILMYFDLFVCIWIYLNGFWCILMNFNVIKSISAQHANKEQYLEKLVDSMNILLTSSSRNKTKQNINGIWPPEKQTNKHIDNGRVFLNNGRMWEG